jgi:3-oxoacyl-[acyl-carrier-protein] synthase II
LPHQGDFFRRHYTGVCLPLQKRRAPTINLTEQGPACNVNIAANQAVHRTVKVALNNAFGFGGHNTCAVFSAWE